MISANGTSEPFFAGRLSKPNSDLLRNNNEAPRLQWEIKHLDAVLQVDQAHVVMLAEEGIITQDQAKRLLGGLAALSENGSAGFSTTPGYGSIVLQIEKKLAEQVGEDTAGRLCVARSRLDQGATVRRMVDRENLLKVMNALLELQQSLITKAEEHADTPAINYTHLQQAQPATFGHYLQAYKARLDDSYSQLVQVYERTNRSPLGAAGLSGTHFPINRSRSAALLGFDQVLENSRQGRDGYYQIEITTVLALMMTVMNDLCTELHIFSSMEFGTVELDDSHCSTSSIFPQKKNPYALETVKARAGDSLGWVASAFVAFRNEGTVDIGSRTVRALGEAYTITTEMLMLTAEVIQGLSVKKSRYEELLKESWVTSNRLSNVLLTECNMDYRSSHGIVARLVKNCLARGISKMDLTISMLQEAAKEMRVEPIPMTEEELRLALDHGEWIKACKSRGGVGPLQFERLLADSKHQQSLDRQWVERESHKLEGANTDLKEASAALQRT